MFKEKAISEKTLITLFTEEINSNIASEKKTYRGKSFSRWI